MKTFEITTFKEFEKATSEARENAASQILAAAAVVDEVITSAIARWGIQLPAEERSANLKAANDHLDELREVHAGLTTLADRLYPQARFIN